MKTTPLLLFIPLLMTSGALAAGQDDFNVQTASSRMVKHEDGSRSYFEKTGDGKGMKKTTYNIRNVLVSVTLYKRGPFGELRSHAKELERQGALILDIGGESTRPGAAEVAAEEELDRVLPVVRELRSCTDAVISVDTRHAAVAAAVLEAGADVINDISGLREAGMAELCAAARCGVVAMHMQGRPETMQDAPSYGDVVREVRGYFEERYDFLLGGI